MIQFSERMGYKKPKVEIQHNSMDDDLRNGIWSCLHIKIFDNFRDHDLYGDNDGYYSMNNLIEKLWLNFFKKPIDRSPSRRDRFVTIIREWFFGCGWYDIYDFVEFVINNHNNPKEIEDFIQDINNVLKRELAGYRIISSTVTPITSEADIAEIEKAIKSPIKEVNLHINRALELMSDRKNPDYRNSIKESISAVETICKLITKNNKATLGDALNELQKSKRIQFHGAIQVAFKSLYGYTNDAEGIRHSLMEEEKLDLEDALFMLTSCSAFINYLLVKSSKTSIKF